MSGFRHLGLPKRSQDTASRCGPDWYEWIERSVQTRVGKARNFTYLIVKSISQGYRLWKLFSKTDLGMSRVTKVVKVNRYLTPSYPGNSCSKTVENYDYVFNFKYRHLWRCCFHLLLFIFSRVSWKLLSVLFRYLIPTYQDLKVPYQN